MRSASPFSTSRQVVGLLLWLLAAYAAAAVGGFASAGAGAFYAELVRPAWAPPGWLFGPVWSILYTLMGVSAWLVWRVDGFSGARSALVVFLLQLVANALWSWLYFGLRLGGVAFAELLLLWALILATLVLFWRVNRVAAVLLAPYLAWVTFAAALNFATWRLNPGLLGG